MRTLAFMTLCVALPLGAQAPMQTSRAVTSPGSAVGSARELWGISSKYVLTAAQQVPESLYAFEPTADVRSFGQVIAHVANGQQLLCAMALGQKPVENAPKTKGEIVAALEQSNSLCARAYSLTDADGLHPLDKESQATWIALGFGTPSTRLHALMMNAWHDNEHYGNIVTYMRLEGMIPPSSQPKP